MDGPFLMICDDFLIDADQFNMMMKECMRII